MFPGQGSQVKGMGKELFREFPDIVQIADDVLGYSIEELCLEDPNGSLRLTQYTQPALYTVNAISYYKKVYETGRKPDFVAGHSLGEYNALLASEVFDFRTGLYLVKKRGELMGRASGGAMAAVVKLDEQRVREIIAQNGLDGIDIANLNSPKQIVISGLERDIDMAKDIFEREGALYMKLKVSAAFHSRYMAEAQKEFAQYIKRVQFSSPKIPIISNVTAREHEADKIRENMVTQLCAPVRWTESIQYLLANQCQKFEEIGLGKVLTKLVAKIKAEQESISVLEPNHSIIQNGSKMKFQQLSGGVYHRVEQWNQRYHVGTQVTCPEYSERLKTRTEAMVLFGHRAAVYMENYNGYFDLDEINPV